MKSIILLIAVFFVFKVNGRAQTPDSVLKKRLTIDGACLCETSLSKLKSDNNDLHGVELEEMDLAKGCYGQDARFIAGKGYSTKNHPGMIFQTEQASELISKMRLTKDFKGKIPDGNFIDLSTLKLKDVFKLYSQFKNKWGSRGCSDYWNFSNDTISFFVKIDKSKKPQFPIDEAYYADKPVEAVDFVTSCYAFKNTGDDNVIISANNEPVFFIDSIRVNKNVLKNYEPNEIATVTVYKDSSAIKKMGPEAKYGLIYIETKSFVKSRYLAYFKSKSQEYSKLILSLKDDSSIQYIINKRVLTKNFEGDLSSIDDKIFKGIEIITKQQLKSDYGVDDKEYGVIIKSDIPDNLKNGANKF